MDFAAWLLENKKDGNAISVLHDLYAKLVAFHSKQYGFILNRPRR